jgi:hypothetical protein
MMLALQRVEHTLSTENGSQGWMRKQQAPVTATLYEFKVLTQIN